jgi:hypothetical protein
MTTKMDDEQKKAYHREYQRARVQRLKGKPLPEGVEHGTTNAYNNYSCRCEVCKGAYREFQKPQVAERRAKGLSATDPRHGTYNGYANYGCRCTECVEANRVYAIGYRLKTGQITAARATELIDAGLVK